MSRKQDYVSWYVVAWRLPFWCLVYLFHGIASLCVLAGFGLDSAAEHWERIK